MPDDATVLICIPVASLSKADAAPGARKRRCDLCGIAVWVSRTSPKTAKRYCMPCAKDIVEPDDKFQPLTSAQLAEISAKIGN